MTTRRRADILLVQRGLFESRKRAQDAIAAGLVRANGRPVTKASEALAADSALEASAVHPFVSRGGTKLVAGLDHFGLDPTGKICLDIGASTGGFVDVLLQRGARLVHAVDVGHGQLHDRLAADPRVVAMEGTDARRLSPKDFPAPPQLITCDVSFISLCLVLPNVLGLAAAADLICLIKPQFESGPGKTVKGIVADPALHASACSRVSACVSERGWQVLGTIASPIPGGDGNREFLLGASRS